MNGRTATTEAPAKVNLFLRVLERRGDGYHELDTLFQSVSLCDDVRVTLGGSVDDPKFRTRDGISLFVDGPDLGPIQDNLAWRAAAVFRERVGVAPPISIALTKRIPATPSLWSN